MTYPGDRCEQEGCRYGGHWRCTKCKQLICLTHTTSANHPEKWILLCPECEPAPGIIEQHFPQIV
jgi:hypothetical protein